MVALDDLRTDPLLFLQLEGGLKQVHVQTRGSIKPRQSGDRLSSFKTSVANYATNDGTVFLFNPSLIVLLVGARSRHLDSLGPAPVHDQVIHEHRVVVEIHAPQSKGEELLRFHDGVDDQTTFAQQHWNAFRPSGGDVGEHQGLHETAARAHPGMGDKIHLDKPGRRLVPIVEGPHRHRAANRRARSCSTPTPAAGDRTNVGEQSVHRRRADRQQLSADQRINLNTPMALERRSQKDKTTWEKTARIVEAWLPKSRILHPWPSMRFAVKHPR